MTDVPGTGEGPPKPPQRSEPPTPRPGEPTSQPAEQTPEEPAAPRPGRPSNRPTTPIPEKIPITFEGGTPRVPEHLDWTSPAYTGTQRRRRRSSSSESSGSSRSSSSSSRSSSSGSSSSKRTKASRIPAAAKIASASSSSSKSSTKKKSKKKKSWFRPRNVIGIPLVVIVLVVLGFGLYLNGQLNGIRRAPFNADIGGPVGQGTNVLLVGSEAPAHDLRVDRRSMIVQLVHLSGDGSRAAVIDLPSNMLLPVPVTPGKKKQAPLTLLSAYQKGGDPALVAMVQDELQVNVDHVSQIGFTGYVKVTDRLGGVELPTLKGTRSFTGPQALAYVDAPHIDSITAGIRNQQWLRAMFTSAFTPGVLLDPVKVVELLHDTTPNLVLDETFTAGALRGMVWRARHLRPATIRYLTAPYRRYAKRPGGTVLLPDTAGMRQLGQAIRADNDSGIAVFDN